MEERIQFRLESLEDIYIMKGEDDVLLDKYGCLVYVSFEIFNIIGIYFGKVVDVWSLGVMFYIFLVG